MISDEMLLANMFIGYFVPSTQWPCPFQSLNLQLLAIHVPFIATVDGQNCQVKPEVVLASEESAYGVGLEVKSSHVPDTQLHRYAVLEPASIKRGLGFGSGLNLMYDTTFLTEAENGDKVVRFIRRGLRKHGLHVNGVDTFPVLVREDQAIYMHAGVFAHPELQHAFSSGVVAAEDDQPPTHFIRFTAESSHGSMLNDVLNIVHGRIVKAGPFTTRDVCVAIIKYWDVYGTQEKRAVINKVHRILTKASREDYRAFFKVGNLAADVGDTEWRPIPKKLNVQRIQSLNTANRAFLDQYRHVTDEEFRVGDQLTLTRPSVTEEGE